MMTDTTMFGEMDFEQMLQSVTRERRAEMRPPAGLEQRLMARLAQQRRFIAASPFGFAERTSAPGRALAMWFAVGAHAAVILMILVFASRHSGITTTRELYVTKLVAPMTLPDLAPRAVKSGGGGGQTGAAPVSRGHLPRFAEQQLMAPKVSPTVVARMEVEPTLIAQKDLRMADNTLPNIGVPSSSVTGVSPGNGSGGGLGSGVGTGIGPGSGGDAGGGIFHIGGAVSKPQLLNEPQAEYSEEARKAKFSGNVEVYLWVDQKGNPSHIRVIHGAGMGLDEKAIEAVRQYRFKPAMKDGRPVSVDLYVEVNFQIL